MKLDVIKLKTDREQLLIMIRKASERLAKLAGGVAVIKVGGASEVEVKKERSS